MKTIAWVLVRLCSISSLRRTRPLWLRSEATIATNGWFAVLLAGFPPAFLLPLRLRDLASHRVEYTNKVRGSARLELVAPSLRFIDQSSSNQGCRDHDADTQESRLCFHRLPSILPQRTCYSTPITFCRMPIYRMGQSYPHTQAASNFSSENIDEMQVGDCQNIGILQVMLSGV